MSKATKEAQAEAAGAMAATMELVRRFNLTISSEESTLARKLARALKLSAGRTAQEKALMQRDLSGVFATMNVSGAQIDVLLGLAAVHLTGKLSCVLATYINLLYTEESGNTLAEFGKFGHPLGKLPKKCYPLG